MMVAEARRTGAKALYSDEDKIGDDGLLTEPHLKPNWNYRLLLTNNYVCHFLDGRARDAGQGRPARPGTRRRAGL